MADRLQQLLQPGKHAVGNWISIGHPAVAEIGSRDFDFVILDTEHTPIGLETLENMLRAVDAVDDAAPIVRVPWNDPARIKRVLDLGPAGLMIPMVETAEEAEEAVSAMRYPPEGIRGAAPARASDYGRTFGEYFDSANEDLITVVQIETEQGAENVDEIVSVDGVDAVMVGQADLSASMGLFGEWDDDRFQSALDSVIETTHDAGKPIGMLALDHDDIHKWVDAGADFVTVGADIVYLAEGSDAARAEFEAATGNSDEGVE